MIVSLVFMFPYAYLFNIIGNQHNLSSNTSNCIVNDKNSLLSSCIFTFGFYYILPLSIIFLCYLSVFLHVRRTGYQVVKRLVSSYLELSNQSNFLFSLVYPDTQLN
jgi:hypothetical protein